MNQVGIETSQHVQLNYNPAGVGDRIVATIVDGVVILCYYMIVIVGFVFVVGSTFAEPSDTESYGWIFILVLAIPIFMYDLILEVFWQGKTVGKWLVGIQVVKIDGTNPNLGSYLIRWLFRLLEISMTSGLIAFITVLINGKGQRLGDIAAKTCVIKTKKKVKLSDTIYSQTETEYTPLFPRVAELTDKDISTIKEVLGSKKDYEYNTWFVMVQRTANIIQMKLGIQKEEFKADEFLNRVIADYNHLHRS